MRELKAYQCEYCENIRKTKKLIVDHERLCFKNADSKSCITCSKFSHHYDEVTEYVIRVCESKICLDSRLNTGCAYHTNTTE